MEILRDTMEIYGDFEGFSLYSALFGLVMSIVFLEDLQKVAKAKKTWNFILQSVGLSVVA